MFFERDTMKTIRLITSITVVGSALLGSHSLAQQAVPARDDPGRPKIGLALSGGGARGGAHVGVLRALRELGIPIDYIAGTSMGSVIGGFYASGLDEDEIAALAADIDWGDLFSDSPSRDNRTFHRKRDDDLFLVKQEAGLNNGQVELPMGLVQGQDINLFLARTTLPVAHVQNFDELPIPFRAVATDIATGEVVVLDHGSLGDAIRASLSIPAAFAPIEIDGRLLVDGGVAQNLPVDTVRAMGADIVIAVDISTPLAGREELTSVISITSQLFGFLTVRGTEEQKTKLGPNDVLISPDLHDVTTSDFARIEETFAFGYDATMAAADELRALALPAAQDEAHRAARPNPRREEPPEIDFVRLANDTNVSDNIVEARLESIPTGVPLDLDATELAIERVYGLELFEKVSYSVVEEGGVTGLEVNLDAKEWGPNYLEAGLKYSSAGDDNTMFGVSMSYVRTAMNSLGAEWRSTLALGDEPSASTIWHQPLGWNAMTFVSAGLHVDVPLINIYQDTTRIAQLQETESLIDLAIGREFGTWGELRFGVTRGKGDWEVVTGPGTTLIPEEFDRGELWTRFTVDTLDNLYFPVGGGLVSAEWRSSREHFGADPEFDQFRAKFIGAKTFGRHTVAGGVRYDTTRDGTAPAQNLFEIGGFWNLSGFVEDELTGQHAGRLLAAYYRRIGNFGRMPAYAGITLERGNAWDLPEDISWDNSLTAGSLWVGADTPVGPVYIAYGQAQGNRKSLYIFLGSVFH
jgi:NTE family protein